jgi:hypothetical protein
MATAQGSLSLLNDPVAQKLLQSTIPARLAYVWPDGTPRTLPIWFHWNGEEIVLGTPVTAPKVEALRQNPKVAVTIDSNEWPSKVLMIRGTASVEIIEGMSPEYAAAAERYLGKEQGQATVEQMKSLLPQMARVRIQPEWVGILDFEQRWPSAIMAAMAGG